MRRHSLIALFALTLASCAETAPVKEISPNEQALREVYPGAWGVLCRDLNARDQEKPFLRFTILEPDRIADLHFLYGVGPRYDEHAIPSDAYGPFHGEEVTDDTSTYQGANEYKITDDFFLFLPYLRTGFENAQLGRDRDTTLENAAAEVKVNGQRYASILHLRCVRR